MANLEGESMNEVAKSALLKTGYTKNQIAEIEQGQEEGLPVKIYFDKKFLAMQMRQIRLGLKENLPVEIYAKEEYDWFQMEEIRIGLSKGIDVSGYADPAISYEKMREIRKGLQRGISLTEYLELDARIIAQIRKAKVSGLDILNYVEEGYDAEQLIEITKAMKTGVDISPYLSKEYRGEAMAQIRIGLEEGVDVSVYAYPYFNWLQMREIRRGIMNQVDTEYYRNHLYSWEQMQEIRVGLEQGLPVKEYLNFRYTAREMKKRREMILFRMQNEQEEIQDSEVRYDDFLIDFVSGDMEAYITVLAKNKEITRESLLEFLEEQGVRYGLIEESIERVLNGESYNNAVLIARGSMPNRGKDGWYKYYFRTEPDKTPMVLQDGSVDYQNMEWFETVTRGQKLAYYYPAEEGEAGYTVKGVRLPAQKGMEKGRLQGKGIHLESDQRTYYAASGGIITLEGNRLDITPLLVLKDVTHLKGNVSFDGIVHITGNVGKGTEIAAGDDIVIDGYVEAATLRSSGSIVLKKGMNAGGSGFIKAGKDVISKFFESVKVEAGGNIEVDRCLNSDLHAGGTIFCHDLMAGGTVFAGGGYQMRHVGNQAGLTTVFRIGVDDRLQEHYIRLRRTLRDVEHELEIFKSSKADLEEKYPPEVRNNMDFFLKVENAVYTKRKQIETLQQEKENMEKGMEKSKKAKAVIKGQVYEGVVFKIDKKNYELGEQYNVIVRGTEDGIRVVQNI